MASLTQVLNAMQDQINADLTNANAVTPLGAPWQVNLGSQISIDMAQTQGSNSGVIIGLWPLKARRMIRFLAPFYAKAWPSVSLIATHSGNSVTFSGSVTAGLNVHAILAPGFNQIGTDDALYQTQAIDTLTTVATGLAAAISAKTGFSATANGATVSMGTGALQKVNVGGTGSITQESGRMQQMIQASIYAPDPDLRGAFADAVANGLLGSITQPFVTLPDNTGALIELQNVTYDDGKQIPYTLYEAHLTYSAEYILENVSAATEIGAVEATQTQDSGTSQTSYTGG